MKQIDRTALLDWEKFKEDIDRATPVDRSMSAADREKHRRYLERHPVEWIKFFFPNYAKYEFADFQKRAIQRIIAHDEWFEVLSWSRELAKSTVSMFVVLFVTLTGRKKNVIMTSNSKDNAVRLLAPYRANLEANGRIQAYYGKQETPGSWTEDEFVTKGGVAFRAIGAGQSPRGSRNEAIRPDVLLVDDFDTDEDTKNPDTIQKRWDWWENALYPTRSISEPTLVIFCGNIIAKDCCVVRAGDMADHWDIVNIRDRNGRSTWPEKNTEEFIDRTLSKISTKAAQGEYFNNPISVGEVFETIAYGKVPPLSKFKFLVAYGDPAPGESKGKERQVLQDGLAARQTRGTALCHQDFSLPSPERRIHRLVCQTVGVRRRKSHRVLLHGEQQTARPFLSAGVQTARGQSPERAENIALYPGGREEENRQGNPDRGQPRTLEPGGEPDP